MEHQRRSLSKENTIESAQFLPFSLPNSWFLGNISKDFIINSKKKMGLKGIVKFISFDFNPIDTNGILDIHKYLMNKNNVWKLLK